MVARRPMMAPHSAPMTGPAFVADLPDPSRWGRHLCVPLAPASVVARPAERERESHILGAVVDLLEYQSSPQGGWLVPDVARYAIWAGITWPGVAGYSWVAVAVGSQLGFHLGCQAARANQLECNRPGCQQRGLTHEPGPVLARAAPNLGYSHQGQEFSDHATELRKHPQVDPGSRTFWVWGISSVSAGHP